VRGNTVRAEEPARTLEVAVDAPRAWATFASAYDPRYNNFDVLRFALAAAVIWSHCFPLSGRSEDWMYAASGQIDGGSLAVDGFFVLSGFLITQSWLARPELAAYARKRMLRIMPALLAALVFGAFVVGPFVTELSSGAYLLSGRPWAHFLGVALHRYLLIPGAFATNPLPDVMNSSLWSLRYELLCYGLLPVLALTGPRRWGPAVIGLLAVSWCAYGLTSGLGILPTLVRLVACFAAGMFFYTFRNRIPYTAGLVALAAAVLAVTFVGGGLRLALPIAGGYLLLCAAFARRIPAQRFGRHGDLSYGLYVYAYPVQQSWVYFFGPDVAYVPYFVATFVLTAGLAFCSWHLIEAPALARKGR
jgi:peptidoglycan/LPS O-acetylase OafA/YrhL